MKAEVELFPADTHYYQLLRFAFHRGVSFALFTYKFKIMLILAEGTQAVLSALSVAE